MATYNEASFKVLRGLDPVRQRPGMYTNLESPNHIIAEVVDNACDEALAGFAKNIFVTAHTDGSISVLDDGRGIPVGIHKEEGRSVVEVAFTVLHSGGKFDKEGDGAYKFAGGLHGVGVAVTNALSKKVEVMVYREGGQHEVRFVDGVAEKPLAKTASCPKNQTGTAVRAWPNPKYFDSPGVNLNQLEFSLRSKAVLLPGVTITLNFEKSGETKSWNYPDGLRGYLAEALSEFELATPILLQEKFTRKGDATGFAEGEGASWALTWSAEGNVVRESYVNLIPTPAGGTHEAGLRDGVFNSVKAFAELHGLLPKGVKLVPEDVFSRASFVLSAKVLDPQFQGQTKEKLVSREALRLVSSMIKDPLDLWLNEHLEPAKKIVELAIQQAQARLRSAQKVEKKKGSSVAVLPGKLTDCSSSDASRTELFLVEGDSAGGSAKQGRNKEFQAVLPLRGKVLNTFEVEKDRLFANNEIHDIAVAIGVDPHAPTDDVDLSGLRYNAILHHGRRRRGRCAHLHPAAHAVLPPLLPGGRSGQGVHRAAAAVPHRCACLRQETSEQDLRAERSRAHRHPGPPAQGKSARRQLDDIPLQRPGRDEPGATVGDHAQSGYQTCAVREGGPGFIQRDDEDIQHADGQAGGFDTARLAGVSRE